MKSRLPKLTRKTVVLLAMLAWSGIWSVRGVAQDASQPLMATSNPAEVPSPFASATGQELLAKSAKNLAAMPSIEAKMRQRVALFGQYLIGSGTYRQLIIGSRKRLRLELRLQVADKTTSLLQISDGVALWEKRDFGGQPSMSYVNLRRVRETLAEQGGSPPSGTATLAIGGLDFLLRGLNESFTFQTPVPQELGELPVWQIRGDWKPTGQGDATSKDLPPHVPQHVVVWLGRDELLPLFPYRIDFRRNDDGNVVSMVTLELFEVQHCDVEPRYFEMQLDDQQIEDRTAEMIEQLQVAN